MYTVYEIYTHKPHPIINNCFSVKITRLRAFLNHVTSSTWVKLNYTPMVEYPSNRMKIKSMDKSMILGLSVLLDCGPSSTLYIANRFGI